MIFPGNWRRKGAHRQRSPASEKSSQRLAEEKKCRAVGGSEKLAGKTIPRPTGHHFLGTNGRATEAGGILHLRYGMESAVREVEI